MIRLISRQPLPLHFRLLSILTPLSTERTYSTSMTMTEIDPEGDMILTLTNPNAPFAVWHDDNESTTPPTSQESSSQVSQESEIERPTLDPVKCITEFSLFALLISYIRVSSRHISLASGRTEKMRHRWEQTKESDGYVHLPLEDWDTEALLIIMNIIHLRNRLVPSHVSIDMLAKLAVIVDYFEFHEAVEVFSKSWMEHLRSSIPISYCRDLILWIWIAHVFNDSNTLKTTISTAIQQSPAPIQDLGLPIPERIIDQVNKDRREEATKIVEGLRTVKAGLQADALGCSYFCRCLFLGAFIKQLTPHSVFDAIPEPLLGWSLADMIKTIRMIPDPFSNRNGLRRGCTCSVPGFTDSFLGKAESNSSPAAPVHSTINISLSRVPRHLR
ncbi:hypothetical protein GGR52DRAFT_234124 [Hypoxylon sp. FL1284]|nr:hypothetical protein GGR52DRAFT_234124 [Hypoxylon sp. FL1284]